MILSFHTATTLDSVHFPLPKHPEQPEQTASLLVETLEVWSEVCTVCPSV